MNENENTDSNLLKLVDGFGGKEEEEGGGGGCASRPMRKKNKNENKNKNKMKSKGNYKNNMDVVTKLEEAEAANLSVEEDDILDGEEEGESWTRPKRANRKTVKKKLEELGYTIVRSKNHFVWRKEGKTVVVSKTPSDNRRGYRNAMATIRKVEEGRY